MRPALLFNDRSWKILLKQGLVVFVGVTCSLKKDIFKFDHQSNITFLTKKKKKKPAVFQTTPHCLYGKQQQQQ